MLLYLTERFLQGHVLNPFKLLTYYLSQQNHHYHLGFGVQETEVRALKWFECGHTVEIQTAFTPQGEDSDPGKSDFGVHALYHHLLSPRTMRAPGKSTPPAPQWAILSRIHISSHLLAPWFHDLHNEHAPHLLRTGTDVLFYSGSRHTDNWKGTWSPFFFQILIRFSSGVKPITNPTKVLNENNSVTTKFVILNEVNLFNTKSIFPTQKTLKI